MVKPVIYLTILLSLTSISQVTANAYVNGFDQPFDFRCPPSHIISYISSVHNNDAEDRMWEFHCRTVVSTTDCTVSGYVNGWDEMVVYRCPDNRVLTGVSSYHDNGAEDRRFSFQCCRIGNRTPTSCHLTNFVNNWDDKLTMLVPEGRAIKGAYSYHDNSKEDRRWRFEVCDI